MNNRRTEESVRRAFGNAAPNNLNEVMEKCEEQKGRIIILENTAKKKSGRDIPHGDALLLFFDLLCFP